MDEKATDACVSISYLWIFCIKKMKGYNTILWTPNMDKPWLHHPMAPLEQ